MVLGPALAANTLGSHSSLSWVPPSPAQKGAICRPLCGSCQVTLEEHRWWLTMTSLPEKPQSRHTQWTALDHTEAPSPNYLHKQQTQGVELVVTRTPLKSVLLCGVGQMILYGCWWSKPVHAANWPEGKSLPFMCLEQSRLNFNRKVYVHSPCSECNLRAQLK